MMFFFVWLDINDLSVLEDVCNCDNSVALFKKTHTFVLINQDDESFFFFMNATCGMCVLTVYCVAIVMGRICF